MRWTTLLCALALGCVEITPPMASQPFDPPHQYRVWYAQVETCLDDRRSFERIEWYSFPEPFECDTFGLCSGLWKRPRTIYVQVAFLQQEPTVKHEMIHYIMQDGGHSAPWWEKCDPVLGVSRELAESP